MQSIGYLFAAIFAAIMGGMVISLARRAVDTLSIEWAALAVGLVAVLVIGAILTDPARGRGHGP